MNRFDDTEVLDASFAPAFGRTMSTARVAVPPDAHVGAPGARVAMVTNIPVPYRLPVYEALNAAGQIDLEVYFCSGIEPDRDWKLPPPRVPHVFMKGAMLSWRDRYIHCNPGVWHELARFRPDVVITNGFNPTHLLAFLYAITHGARHVPMTDGTADSERGLTALHRGIRRFIFLRSRAFIGASVGSFHLYRDYGVASESIFKSHLCADNYRFCPAALESRDFDFLFCGRIVPQKMPVFALEVAAETARSLGRRVRLLVVGSGKLEGEMRAAASRVAEHVDTVFAGFANQAELPAHYARCKLLLFTTRFDPWGVVANEACAAGTPVLVACHAGAAGDLILDGVNGHVLPLDRDLWADAATRLLSDVARWQDMSAACLASIAGFTYANAAEGIRAAIGHAMTPRVGAAAAVARSTRRRVVVIQRRMTHYRIPLFERMRELLREGHIELDVVYGDPTPSEGDRADGAVLSWGRHVPCRYWLRGRLCWQWAWPVVRGADLVIVTQENKLLLNYLLAFFRPWLPLALWGHGRNFQAADPDEFRERLKRKLLPRADWWFAYTESSAGLVRSLGYPAHRITVLNNAIDTGSILADLKALESKPRTEVARELGLGAGPVALAISSLYPDKRIDFLIDAARRVRRRIPDFQLVVVGDGALRKQLQEATADEGWIRWFGMRKGAAKAACLHVADVMLNPFAIGLVVLDSFSAGVPIVLTAGDGHNPEVAYLRNDDNCVIAPRDVDRYADAVVALLRDHTRRARLGLSGKEDANILTIDAMATRFCGGIARFLSERARAR